MRPRLPGKLICYINSTMTKLEKIEQDISQLAPADVHKLAAWIEEFRADLWDQQIEADAATGKLDGLVAQARADIAAGRVRPL